MVFILHLKTALNITIKITEEVVGATLSQIMFILFFE